jgi:hypothetical protein
MLTLVQLRRNHHLFPVRPYLPLLIDALEDSDANVRECAKQSVVELFTGPGVTDGARADLKKEMTKKAVRKGIVEWVLAKVSTGGAGVTVSSLPPTPTEGTDNEEGGVQAKKEYVPPSLALMGRRPTVGTGVPGPSHSTRSASSSTFVPSRPESRGPVVQPSTSASIPDASSPEVKPVYVCTFGSRSSTRKLTPATERLLPTATLRTSFQPWLNHMKAKKQNTTGLTERGPSPVYVGCSRPAYMSGFMTLSSPAFNMDSSPIL